MKTLIIYKSTGRKNTEKVAQAMAGAINAKLVKVGEVTPEELAGYDLIGFGSGIYFFKHHKELIGFVEKMPAMKRNVFIFSTMGTYREENHKPLREKLVAKGCEIVGEFSCPGASGPLASHMNLEFAGLIGGKNKGHPDEEDLNKARAFVKSLMK